MSRQCPSLKRNGDRCSGSVPEDKYHCWFHDPANSDKRRAAASKGGKGNRAKLSKQLHARLDGLIEQVVEGELEPYPASVAGQLIKVKIALIEQERKLKETEELESQLEELTNALEEQQARQKERGYGYTR